MATRPRERLVAVRCDQLQPGMYVAELDRSWLQTPFAGRGFLITAERQIKALQRACEYVYVDLERSFRQPEAAIDDTSAEDTLPSRPMVNRPMEGGRRALQASLKALARGVTNLRSGGLFALAPCHTAAQQLADAARHGSDDLAWLLATEFAPAFLYRRALGSASLAARFGAYLGFDAQRLGELALGGLLLDIGKIGVPVAILAKRGKLTPIERGYIYRHVRHGIEVAQLAGHLPRVTLDMLAGHHERLDGLGYPGRLKGTQIPLFARLAAIVDTYDAMTLDRSYAPRRPAHLALRRMQAMRNRKLDAALLRDFVRAVGLYPTGSWLQLRDGRIGIVRAQEPGQPLRPKVAILSDPNGGALTEVGALWQPRTRHDIAASLLPPGPGMVASGAYGAAIRSASARAA